MSERPSSSNAGEMQTVARVSVKDRLGPLPPNAKPLKRRDRSVDRSHRRGRKISKSAQGPEGGSKARIPVHERLGPLNPPQAFKKNDGLFQKRNRQQVWRHQGYNFKAGGQQQAPPGKEPEVKQRAPAVANAENNVESVKFAKSSVPAVLPVVQPFNAELHRQAWTWVRPTATSSTAMEVDESS